MACAFRHLLPSKIQKSEQSTQSAVKIPLTSRFRPDPQTLAPSEQRPHGPLRMPAKTTIRRATPADIEAVRAIDLAAFGPEEAETVARLSQALILDAPASGILNLVAEENGSMVGHTAFSPLTAGNPGPTIGFLLAPLAVTPARHRAGIGSQLVREGLRLTAATGTAMAFVYGDPAYYARFGFRRESADGFHPPHRPSMPDGWLARVADGAIAPQRPRNLACVPALDRPELW